MSEFEPTSTADGRGLDRRTLIKRAAAAGAVAWTAPMIIDSLSSPAAAATCGTQPRFVGVGAQTASATSPLAPALPTGGAAGDLFIVIATIRGTDAASISTPAGYSLVPGTNPATNTFTGDVDYHVYAFYKIAGGSESSPSITFANGTATAQMIAYRCFDNVTPFDANAVGGSTDETTSATYTPPAPNSPANTVTNNALAVSIAWSNEENALALSATDQGFTVRMSGASYDDAGGGTDPQSVGLADKIISPAGAYTGPTWTTTTGADPVWAGMTFAVKPPP